VVWEETKARRERERERERERVGELSVLPKGKRDGGNEVTRCYRTWDRRAGVGSTVRRMICTFIVVEGKKHRIIDRNVVHNNINNRAP